MTSMSLRREKPLFENSLSVKVFSQNQAQFQGGSANEVLDLTIRVIAGTKGVLKGQTQRILHIEFTNPENFNFLYTLQIGEADYPDLKHDQSLACDFADFPDHVTRLLNMCKTDTAYSAIIRQAPGNAHFEIDKFIEWRSLTLLKLVILPGNDEDMKTYLAARLSLVGLNCRCNMKKCTHIFDKMLVCFTFSFFDGCF